MAGIVKADRQLSLDSLVLTIRPDICPVEALNRTMPPCIAMSVPGGHYNWCPFAHGLRIRRAGSIYDLGWASDLAAWLYHYRQDFDRYEVVCLRKESHGTQVGAQLRP